jgi:V-type H+-transporting ATPase subunit H
MSVQPPAYLASLKSNIRSRAIPWDHARRARDLTDEQFAKIDLVKNSSTNREQAVEGDIDGFRRLFAGGDDRPSVFETASKNTKVVQFLLVLLADLVEEVPALARSLARLSSNIYQHFLPLLTQSNNAEDPIPLLAATTASSIMATARDNSTVAQNAFPTLLTFLSGLAKNADANMQDIAVQQYSTLLYGPESRTKFWAQRSETVKPLVEILRSAAGATGEGSNSTANLWRNGSANSRSSNGFEGQLGGGVGLQLLYHVLLVMWQTSFEAATIGNEMNEEYDIVMLYTQLLRRSPKEKTTRLLLSTLNNLLSKNQKSLLSIAALANLPSLLETLSTRHFTDSDLLDDLQNLRDMLDEHTKTKTTFDEYVAEVESGHLRASPPHRSQVFWTENARKIMDYENGAVLRKIADIMTHPWDNDKNVLAIACNDIGALVREAPERRHQLDKLGIKGRIMELMTDADENVRWESLRALGGWLKYSFDSN